MTNCHVKILISMFIFTPYCLNFRFFCKPYWYHTVNGHTIQFNNTPFSLGEKKLMDCQYGVQYKQPRLTNSKCIYLQGSRKKGCLAHIKIKEFNVYPDYSVNSQVSPSLSKKQIRTIKENSL